MKKVLAILGSPRAKGNSAVMTERFLETAQGLGAETTCFALNELNYKGCQACRACKTKMETCVIQDGLSPVLAGIYEADIIVVAVPVYMGHFTGQFKSFMDRCYSFMVPDYLANPQPSRIPPGKKLVFIMTQGAPEVGYGDLCATFETWAKRVLRIAESHVIRVAGMGPTGSVTEINLRAAEETARRVMAN